MLTKYFYPFLSILCLLSFDTLAVEGEDKKKGHDKSVIEGEHHENHFEVEVSYNSAAHFEFTSSVYFAHLTKFQGTVEFTGHHFAGCFVREIPLGHSKFGTFVGLGSTFGFEKEDEHSTSSAPHVEEVATHSKDWEGSIIFQSGMAYSVDKHWSTGFTLSPGVDIETRKPNFGMTLDLVFGF
ncbi:hypothetical protein [Flammeovirga kamogawensis]|uniref:Outer membrane protein beta-barrel domain-containing protein n=1 Tax=Flammeovirga kamogawensis TaxID=373891 RepID=A0ABX8GYX9_9BACT|nr:hypothetical protein [Flammeovirga kamogawensis]MBB6459210.1 hypothetical protein [Flammeovirga kamogawensis]QWG08775.1 hypothetical protein KM029_07490 [Flammeovirga kamogawensis]TRX67065.1 hypothetical protein EO216_02535 [Flammeovirga kamogawensis]